MKKKQKATSRPKAKIKKRATEKVSSDVAKISFIAGNNFYEIAQVKAEGREENLKKAIEAYKRALNFYTLKDYPYEHAAIQNNLGTAYTDLAGVRNKEKNLQLAIKAYNEALKVRTPEAFPIDYAMIQNNLGEACRRLSEVRDRNANLGLAIKAYNEALKVRTLEAFPVDYAMTQNNLGTAYGAFAEVRDKDKEENLRLAIKAYNEALKVRTLEKFPIYYAETQFNIGFYYLLRAEMAREKGDKGQERESLKTAETAFKESQDLFRKEGLKEWAEKAEKGLADVRNLIGQTKD